MWKSVFVVGLIRDVVCLIPNTGWGGPTNIQMSPLATCSINGVFQNTPGVCQVTCPGAVETLVDVTVTYGSTAIETYLCYPLVTLIGLSPPYIYEGVNSQIQVSGANMFNSSSGILCKAGSHKSHGTFVNPGLVNCAWIPLLAGTYSFALSFNGVDWTATLSLTVKVTPRVVALTTSRSYLPANLNVAGAYLVSGLLCLFNSTITTVVSLTNSYSGSCQFPASVIQGMVQTQIVDQTSIPLSRMYTFSFTAWMSITNTYPALVLSNSHVEVFGGVFSASCCAFNSTPVLTLEVSPLHLTCSTSNLLPGNYSLSIQDKTGLTTSNSIVFVVVSAITYSISAVLLSTLDTLVVVTASIPLTGVSLYCKLGYNHPLLMTKMTTGYLCPTSLVQDIGQLCLELSFNGGYDFTSGCQATITLHRRSRTTGISPVELPVTGGTIQISAIYLPSDSVYMCHLVFPNSTVTLVPATPQSLTLLDCSVPASSIYGVASITVIQDQFLTLETYNFSFVSYYTLTSISPARLTLGGGTRVTLSGSNFQSPNFCVFSPSSGTEIVTPVITLTATEVTCVSPDLTTDGSGTVMVGLYEFDGSLGNQLSIQAVPSPFVLKVNPGFVFEDYIDSVLYVSGSGFLDVPELAIQFTISQQTIPATFISDTLIKATFTLLDFNFFLYSQELVSVSLNSADFFGTAALLVYPSPSLGAASIPKGPWQGGYQITIYGNGFLIPGECVVGTKSGAYTLVSYNKLLCSISINDPGTYQVSLLVLGHVFNHRVVGFRYVGFTSFSFSPRNGPLTGNTLVTLIGDFTWINPRDVIQCSFGGTLVSAVMAGNQVQCTSSPRNHAGPVNLDIYVNGFDYSAALATAQFFYEADPVLVQMSPYIFTSMGGTLIEITGSGFLWDIIWYCYFGTFQVEMYVLTSQLSVCFSPDTPFGLSASLQISANQQHFLTFPQQFSIVQDPSIHQVTPVQGPKSGATIITLAGNHLSNVQFCRFGYLISVPATVIDDHTLNCVTPAWVYPAAVELDTSVNGQMYTSSEVFFQFYDLPAVNTVAPPIVPTTGGTMLTITGAGFRNPTYCQILGVVSTSTYLNETTIQCDSVTSETIGSVQISLSFNGQQYHNLPNAVYVTYTQLTISSISPALGTSATIVTVTGTGFIQNALLVCRFGNSQTSWMRFVSATAIMCMAPEQPAGAVSVSVSNNNVDFVGFSSFVYHWGLAVVRSVPMFTSPAGGTVVSLIALNWPQVMTTAYCKFVLTNPNIHTSTYSTGSFQDTFIVPVTVVDGVTVTCVAPQNTKIGSATVAIEVTSNLQNYSPYGSELLYYEGSFDGFYRTGSQYIECPVGNFCREEKWYAASPCELGYMQPLTRQRKCQECPRGSICPSRTLSADISCPSGQVCSAFAKAAPLLDCPEGSFCLPGTSLISFWDDSPVGQKPSLCNVLGTYCIWGSKVATAGLQCTAGFYCPAGSKRHYGVVPCPSGYYCVNSVINPCPPRYFCPGRGNTAPIICPSSTYNPYPSQSACLPCAAGYICPHEGMLIPQVCPIGYICDTTGLSNPTTMCTAGYYCDGMVMSTRTSRPCEIISDIDAVSVSFCGTQVMFTKADPDNISAQMPTFTGQTENMCCWNTTTTADFISSIGVSTGTTGTFTRAAEEVVSQAMTGMDLYRLLANPPIGRVLKSVSRTVSLSLLRASDVDNLILYLTEVIILKQPLPCPPGMFCLQKTGSNSTTSDQLPPYLCNPGTYCSIAASTPQGTGLCPVGYYCPAGATVPSPAQPGYTTEFQGNVSPAPCMPGSFSNQPTASVCLACPSGYECPNTSMVWPSICLPGTYRPSGQISRCVSCPVQTWTPNMGISSLTECLPCTAGRLCSQPGILAVSQTYPCIEGDVCYEAANLTVRPGCPAGYLCSMDTSPAEENNTECIEGFFCKYRTPERNKYLLQCPTFAYCPPATPDDAAFYATTLNDYTGNLPFVVCPMGTGQDGISGKTKLLECSIDKQYQTSNYTAYARRLQSSTAFVVEMNPVNTSIGTPPTGTTVPVNETFAVTLPYYSMNNFDLAFITIDLRNLNLASGLIRYDVDWTIALTETIGDISTRGTANPITMPLIYLNSAIAKNSVLEFSFQALNQLNLTLSILLYNGLILSETESFMNVASVEIFTPNRASYGTNDIFMAVFDNTVALPINVPANVSTTSPDYLLSFAASPSRYPEMSTPLVQGTNWFTPDSLFWQGGSSYMTSYLPFFSNCKGFGSYIPIWALFELNRVCSLVDPSNTTSISSWDFGKIPSADSCVNITIDCIYDEVPNNQVPNPRWWEVGFGSYVFQISDMPVSVTDYQAGNSGNPINVMVTSTGGVGLPSTVTMDIRYRQMDNSTKQLIEATIAYSDYINLTDAQSSGAEIVNYKLVVSFTALTHTELMILFQFPVSFYAVLDLVIGSVIIICSSAFLCYHRLTTKAKPVPKIKFWGYFVMTIPPMVGGIAMATIPVYVGILLISIFVQGSVWTSVINFPGNDGSTHMGIFDSITPFYDVLSQSDMTQYRQCRVGMAQMIAGLYMLGICSTIILPYSAREKNILYQEDQNGNVLRPVYWRRFGFLLIAMMTVCGGVCVLFFAFSSYFALNVYQCIAALQVLGWVYEEMVEPHLGSSLLKAPLMTFIAVVQSLATFGAADFVAYLQSNFVDFVIMLYNRVYKNDINRAAVLGIEGVFKKVKEIVKVDKHMHSLKSISSDHLPLPQSSDREAPIVEAPPDLEEEKEPSLPSVEESDSLSYYTYEEVRESPPPSEHDAEILLEQDVEPLLEAYFDYATDELGNMYNPIMITFLWYFYDSNQLSSTFGISQNDMPLYFLYALLIIPFLLVNDAILHNCNELFNGWAIHDFLDHLSLRYKSRTTTWAINDTQNVEFVEEKLRTLYLSCFSIQFYFITTLFVTGMLLVLYAIMTILLNSVGYNPFNDRAMWALIPFVFMICGLVHVGTYYIAKLFKIWRVGKPAKAAGPESQETEPTFRELVDGFMKSRQAKPSLVVPSIHNWMQVDLVKAGDEVIRRELNSERLQDPKVRRMFLDENVEWLQHNLEHILTTNNLKKHRGQLLVKFRRMFGDMSQEASAREYSQLQSDLEINQLSLKSVKVAGYWLGRARRIQMLRAQTAGLIASKLKVKCLYCDNTSALQSELIESIEDLFFRFKSAQPAPFRFQLNLWDVDQWLHYVETEAHFRTLCLSCLALCDKFNSDAAKFRKKLSPEELPRRRRAMNLDVASQEENQVETPLRPLLRQWLAAARSRLDGV